MGSSLTVVLDMNAPIRDA